MEASSAGRWTSESNAPGSGGSPLAALRGRLGERFRQHPATRSWVLRQFHRNYYDEADRTWRDTRWRGVPVAKCPFDLWVYQEVIHEVRPDVIVETGTWNGGSACFFGDLLAMQGNGRVVTVDIDTGTTYPEHERVTYVSGSSVEPETVARVRELVGDAQTVMVVLDSDHRAVHVSAELEVYHDLVTPGSSLVVEDTNVNGHPVEPGFGPGPLEAVHAFLPRHPQFVVDEAREKHFVSFNAGGWLRRAG